MWGTWDSDSRVTRAVDQSQSLCLAARAPGFLSIQLGKLRTEQPTSCAESLTELAGSRAVTRGAPAGAFVQHLFLEKLVNYRHCSLSFFLRRSFNSIYLTGFKSFPNVCVCHWGGLQKIDHMMSQILPCIHFPFTLASHPPCFVRIWLHNHTPVVCHSRQANKGLLLFLFDQALLQKPFKPNSSWHFLSAFENVIERAHVCSTTYLQNRVHFSTHSPLSGPASELTGKSRHTKED